MQKRLLTVLSLFILLAVLIGCQSDDGSSSEIVRVSISESKDNFEVNTNFFVVYEDKDTINTFDKLFEDAVKQDGIVDMAEPEYGIEAELKNGSKQQYHLWVGEVGQSSTLMHAENTHTIYRVQADYTDWLIDLLE